MLKGINRSLITLIRYKAASDLRSEAKKTRIGFFWWMLEPVISMLIYYAVFSIVFKRGTNDFIPFLLIGTTVYSWMQSTVMHAANSIASGQILMNQVYIHKIFFPAVTVVADTFKFLVVFAVLLGFVWIYGFKVSIVYLAMPVVLLVELMLILALSLILTSIVPFVPDVRIVVQHLMHLLFFLSGVFFAIDDVGTETQRMILRLNPMATLIEAQRDIIMYGKWPLWPYLGVTAALSAIGIALGVYLIDRNDCTYPKL